MSIALLVARLVLTAVFAVSGIAKIADPPGTRQAIEGFGLPDWLARRFGVRERDCQPFDETVPSFARRASIA